MMLRMVMRALVAGGFLSLSLPVQAQAPASQPAYAFCTITDRSGAFRSMTSRLGVDPPLAIGGPGPVSPGKCRGSGPAPKNPACF